MASYRHAYRLARTNRKKGEIAQSVLFELHTSGYRFVKKDKSSGAWHEADPNKVKDKVKQALREGIETGPVEPAAFAGDGRRENENDAVLDADDRPSQDKNLRDTGDSASAVLLDLRSIGDSIHWQDLEPEVSFDDGTSAVIDRNIIFQCDM